ncbi:MAG: gamma-glutamyltransferase [Nitrospinae bacterium CG11_big_fil_rev_8_21_14_0_20_56_8]|nr:MAG: gamma-glutamyltransferase [Nitrospinae bacterium CG11_big_fil_rev_8_21_14_0_20_56_8]
MRFLKNQFRKALPTGVAVGLLLGLFCGNAWGQESPALSSSGRFQPVFSSNGMVATQEEQATRIGAEILDRGGNAVDAAVAVGFALAVTLPEAGNLGGGGFMLVHMARTGETVAIDYREQAPAAARRDMFLDAKKNPDPEKSRFHHLSAGIPGTVAGFLLALDRYGTLPLIEVMAPAIRLADEGFPVSPSLSSTLAEETELLQRRPETRKIFFKENGGPLQPRDLLVQKDLARTLREIAVEGRTGFYEKRIASDIVRDMQANGGLIALADLKNYRAVLRDPVRGTYRGYEIVSMPPPSSGGIHLIQMLNILEGFPLANFGYNSGKTLHVMAETMKLAYADRSRHLGDPEFWHVPAPGLISKTYADFLRGKIDLNRARPSREIQPGNPIPYEGRETTHFSIMDNQGNAVSNTYSLNTRYGSGIVVPGTGILLNNTMDDFSVKPGVPNAYGLVGGKANEVAPGKRPLSSMCPTLVFKEGQPFLATGSPGGSQIITTTLQVILNVIDHGMNLAAATNGLRIHHQWLPDELKVEPGLDPRAKRYLEERGHPLVVSSPMGAAMSVIGTKEGFYGAADPRRPGSMAAGY